MSEKEPPAPGRDATSAVARIVRQAFGRGCRVASTVAVAGEGARSAVFRCRLEGGDAPSSVVVKQIRQHEGATLPDAQRAFRREVAALTLLSEDEERLPVAPRLHGHDMATRVVVMQDLGEGVSLADALLGEDRAAAENALFAYARSLGRLHARTAGRATRHQELLQSLGGSPQDALASEQAFVRRVTAALPESFADFDFEWTPGLVDDVQSVAATMLEPGPYFALTHGDPCPDNNRLLEGRLLHFDFEHAAFRHALLDGAYTQVPFPTCWCANRLPVPLQAQLLHAYRLEISDAIPAAADDDGFERACVEASAFWFLRSAAERLFISALRQDQQWGIAGLRQRCLDRLETVARVGAASGHLPDLGLFAARLYDRLRATWPEVQAMPLYPAFQG